MARKNEGTAKEPKEETMLVEPGMKFVAIRNCCFDKHYYAGQPVPFSPGQEAPLTLVKLLRRDTAAVEDEEEQQPDAGNTPPAKISDDEIKATMATLGSGATPASSTFVA